MNNYFLAIIQYLLIANLTASGQSSESFLNKLPVEFQGFIENRTGVLIKNDPYQPKNFILGETRLQLEAAWGTKWVELRVKSDFRYDYHREKFLVDLREANALFLPTNWLDIKIGRQVLTWGKGDMLFINDLFPKDWRSFFSGREMSYLKAPSDAAKITFNTKWAQINAIYIPEFNPDRYVFGERISFFDPFINNFRGAENPARMREPNEWFQDAEYAWRIQKYIKGFDIAFYGYYWYWKSPSGVDMNAGQYFFPKLQVHGLSLEGRMLKGIFSFEAGHYNSTDDPDGTDMLIKNSDLRFLAGYSRDLKKDFSIGVQYYIEYMLQHNALVNNLSPGMEAPDHAHDFLTLRLTKLFMSQKINVSFFGFYSISDVDAYLRPNVSYKIIDNLTADVGANIFFGERKTSFLSQFQHNNNVYGGIRFSF